MANMKTKKKGRSLFPEHGPVAENGKEILLSIKDIDITFGKGDTAVHAVTNASFDIYKGETFSLVGESGSGKTTIGRAVIRVNPLAAGEIQYKGVRISGKIPHALDREVIRNVQMVFQDPAASLNERATVDYIISEGLYNFGLFENEADRVQKVERMIHDVGLLPEHLTRYPHEFSGGQRQRIGIARAMVMEPELVVADEPISALDVSIRAQVLNLMKKFQREKGVTYLFIAHDLSVVRFISDRIGVIYKGRIVEVAEAEELFNFPLHPYTHSLISAIPIPDPQLEKNKVQYVYDPSIHDYSTDKPEFVDIGHDHWIYGNKAEIEKYKALREKGELVKAVNIISPEETEKFAKARKTTEEAQAKKVAKDLEEFLQAPPHDTGSIWYTLVSFFLPILGLIGGAVFKHFHYKRNAKSCFKGAIRGFIVLGVILALFLLLLILAVI
nr:ATP-binding cassette domain-containing protein [uncultured Acetatifactor sp.]